MKVGEIYQQRVFGWMFVVLELERVRLKPNSYETEIVPAGEESWFYDKTKITILDMNTRKIEGHNVSIDAFNCWLDAYQLVKEVP